MLRDSCYFINRHRRSIRLPGLFAARLRAGSAGSPRTAGVGDGILIHPEKSFFAIGDGSDRNPRAVRRTMERFVALLEEFPVLEAGRTYGEGEAAELRDGIFHASSGLIRDLYPSDGCTFTGVLLLGTAGGYRGFLFHSGDSILFLIDGESGEVKRLTENNFWFVGRTDRFSQVEEIRLPASSHLIFATDGFAALLPPDEELRMLLGNVCRSHRVEEIPDILFDRYDRSGEGLDDAAVLCLDPAGQAAVRCHPMIIGGTTSEEEMQRSSDIREHPAADSYLSLDPGAERRQQTFF